MIPTSIDGTDITGATIDGTEVTEITVDGQTVFSPGPPTATLEHHYQADNVNLSDGQTINTWTDDVGSSDLTLESGTPTFETNVLNGLPVLRSSGNEYLDTSIPTISQPWTVLCVASLNTISDDHNFWGGADNSDVFIGYNGFFGALQAKTGGGSLVSSIATTNFLVFTLIGDGSNSQFRINSNLEASGSGSEALNNLTVMSAFNGNIARNGSDFAELLVYSSMLSGGDLNEAENYLLDKYNL